MKTNNLTKLLCIFVLINNSSAIKTVQKHKLAQKDIWDDSYISAAVNDKEQKENFEDQNVQVGASESIENKFQE